MHAHTDLGICVVACSGLFIERSGTLEIVIIIIAPSRNSFPRKLVSSPLRKPNGQWRFNYSSSYETNETHTHTYARWRMCTHTHTHAHTHTYT